MVLGAVLAPAVSANETSSLGNATFGNATVSFAAFRWRVAGPAAFDGFAPDVAAAVARGFFTGLVAVPSDVSPAALAAVSRGFLEEVLFDCILILFY